MSLIICIVLFQNIDYLLLPHYRCSEASWRHLNSFHEKSSCQCSKESQYIMTLSLSCSLYWNESCHSCMRLLTRLLLHSLSCATIRNVLCNTESFSLPAGPLLSRNMNLCHASDWERNCNIPYFNMGHTVSNDHVIKGPCNVFACFGPCNFQPIYNFLYDILMHF